MRLCLLVVFPSLYNIIHACKDFFIGHTPRMLSWWWAAPPAWTSPAPPSGAPPLATLQLAADETYQNGYFRQPAGLVWHNYKVREVALKLIFEMTSLYGEVLWKIMFKPTDCQFKHFLILIFNQEMNNEHAESIFFLIELERILAENPIHSYSRLVFDLSRP